MATAVRVSIALHPGWLSWTPSCPSPLPTLCTDPNQSVYMEPHSHLQPSRAPWKGAGSHGKAASPSFRGSCGPTWDAIGIRRVLAEVLSPSACKVRWGITRVSWGLWVCTSPWVRTLRLFNNVVQAQQVALCPNYLGADRPCGLV